MLKNAKRALGALAEVACRLSRVLGFGGLIASVLHAASCLNLAEEERGLLRLTRVLLKSLDA